MIILGLDSSVDACGAALIQDGVPLAVARQRLAAAGSPSPPARRGGAAPSPARAVGRLLPLVGTVLASAGLPGPDPDPLEPGGAPTGPHGGLTGAGLGGIAVTVGPGSYTGLRAAMATAQGLALALGVPVAPVGTLEALAYGAGPRVEPVAACVDARRGRVYGAVYRGWDAAGPIPDGPPELLDARAWAASLPRPVFLTGTGVPGVEAYLRPSDFLAAPAGQRAVDPAAVALIGWERLRAGRGVDAGALVPLYVSRPELARGGGARL